MRAIFAGAVILGCLSCLGGARSIESGIGAPSLSPAWRGGPERASVAGDELAAGTREDAPEPEDEPEPEPDPSSLAPKLACGLHNPMPGAFTAGYAADTGLDLAGIKMPVFAVASGRVVYAEAGHSLWSSPRDTDLAVLVELDEPLAFGDRSITHVWYAHLSELAFEQPSAAPSRRRVRGGERLGTSGVANGAWHLHLGLLLDGVTTQRWGSFLLEDEIRQVLCGLRARQRLPTGAIAPR
ncbi:MAG: hypothetical protein JNL21_13905 [Myxococcales bacterium]|nr:hypothetical protein [Myxococcales bacterium]